MSSETVSATNCVDIASTVVVTVTSTVGVETAGTLSCRLCLLPIPGTGAGTATVAVETTADVKDVTVDTRFELFAEQVAEMVFVLFVPELERSVRLGERQGKLTSG